MLKFVFKRILFLVLFLLLSINTKNLYASACSEAKQTAIAYGIAQCKMLNDLYSPSCGENHPYSTGNWRIGSPYLNGGNTVLPCWGYACGFPDVIVAVIEITAWIECSPEDDIVSTPPVTLSTNNTCSRARPGSIIQTSNQVVGEIIPLIGVPFSLSHFSSRVVARNGDYTSKFKTVNLTNSTHVTGYKVEVRDDNHNLLQENSYVGKSLNDVLYFWNGLDNNIETWGSVNRNFTFKTLTDDNSVNDFNYNLPMGSLKAKKLGLGGWLPSNWHFYDSIAGKIYDGDGNSRNLRAVKEGIYNRIASSDGSEVYYFDSIGRLV